MQTILSYLAGQTILQLFPNFEILSSFCAGHEMKLSIMWVTASWSPGSRLRKSSRFVLTFSLGG